MGQLISLSDAIKLSSEKSIALTTGCFDIFHAGHANFFKQANKYLIEHNIDFLIVGLATSKRLLELKQREKCSFEERALVLSMINGVDYIVPQADPVRLIKLLKPKLYLKGSDYIPQQPLREESALLEYGSKLYFVPSYPLHTSDLI